MRRYLLGAIYVQYSQYQSSLDNIDEEEEIDEDLSRDRPGRLVEGPAPLEERVQIEELHREAIEIVVPRLVNGGKNDAPAVGGP